MSASFEANGVGAAKAVNVNHDHLLSMHLATLDSAFSHGESIHVLILTRSRVLILRILQLLADVNVLGLVAEDVHVGVVSRAGGVLKRSATGRHGLVDLRGRRARLGLVLSGVVLARCRVLVWHELVLASNCHVSLVMTKFSQVSIVLTGIRSVFTRHSVASILSDDGSLAAGHSDANCTFRLILTRSRVRVGDKFVLAAHGHSLIVVAEVLKVSVILAGIGGVLTRHSVTVLLLDDGGLAARHGHTDSSLRFVLAGGRIAIRNELVLATNSHVSLVGAERSEVSIILAGIGSILARNSVAVLFLNDSSLGSRLGDTNGTFRLILSRSRILVGHKFVLATNGHVFVIITEVLEMTIILTRGGSILSRHSVSVLFPDDSSLGSGLGDANCTFRLILSRSRILVGHKLVLATDGHVLIVGTEVLEVTVILTRGGSILARNSVA